MDFKPNISNYKQKILIFISVLFIALILQPTQTVYASWEDTWAASHVDGIGVGGSGGTDTVPNGVDRHNTGYLCYLLTEDGATLSGAEGNAYVFESPGFVALPGTIWECVSRRGHTVSTSKGTAPWNLTPWTQYGADTNMPQIKAYFEGMDGDSNNGVQFVYDNWGEEAATKFMNNEYIIVIETIMHFQWSEITNGDSNELYSAVWDEVEEYIAKYSESAIILMADNAGYSDIFLRWMQSTGAARTEIFNSVRDTMQLALVDAKMKQLKEQGVGKYTLVGDPVIGTIPNLLDYKASLHISGRALDSYTNNVAPLAEYITVGDAGQKAGFVPWTGPTDRNYRFSDADIDAHGVAMFVIKANPDTQTTCDESLQPAPHRPPVESEGTYTIVKNYRTLLEDGTTYQEDGCHSQGDLGSNILIENELEYQVVGWRITNTTNTGISSIDWNPPGSVQGNNGSGTTPTSVTIEPTYTCLYVLLEKVEEEPPEEEDYNYLLSESSITRTVWFSNPDHNKLGNMNNPEWIYEHKFNWASPATPYCEGHPYQGACLGNHEGEHTSSCPKGCPSTCNLPSPHIHEKACDSHHYWNCGSNDCDLNNQTAKCSGTPEWVDKTLELTITNTKQNSYPDILATKEGWNAEVLKGGVEKRFYDNGPIDRKQFSLETHDKSSEITNWDYVCILMRGKDKLTVAEWQNNGDGNA